MAQITGGTITMGSLSDARIASMVNLALVDVALIVTAFGMMTIGFVLTERGSEAEWPL